MPDALPGKMLKKNSTANMIVAQNCFSIHEK